MSKLTTRGFQMTMAQHAANGEYNAIFETLAEAQSVGLLRGKAWRKFADKLRTFIESGKPEFSIFNQGNSKLSFLSFSSLPVVTCPGAGDCISFCYSLKSWRYPAAFFRQMQNTILLQTESGRATIKQAFSELYKKRTKNGESFTMRLYVDGDFASVQDLAFWQSLLKTAPLCNAYGYSKSFAEFLEYADNGGQFADNYLLNLSSGHNASEETVQKMNSLSCVRGKFEAVDVGFKVKSSDHGTKATNSALRAEYKKPAFTCGGVCDNCTPKGHACGLPAFRGVDIIIAVH